MINGKSVLLLFYQKPISMKMSVINPEINKGILAIRKNDPILKKIIDIVGDFDLYPKENQFGYLVRIIVGQQLSINSARAIYSKLENKFNSNIIPEIIYEANENLLIESGLSLSKTKAIKSLASEIIQNNLNLSEVSNLPNEAISDVLTKIKGIGPWTVQNYLIFVLVRLNILPINDLAFRRAIKLNYRFKSIPNDADIKKISMKWGNYQTIASWYLWETINRKLVK